jgi:two-component system nitrate/nitrite response regulator NarL
VSAAALAQEDDLPAGVLHVAVRAADPVRRRGLAALVAAAGHRVAAAEAADVALLDGADTELTGLPTVSLGGTAAESAGLLPPDAGPAQVDAALRAVAAGLLVRAPGLPSGFAMLGEAPPLLTPREVEVLALVGDGCSNKAAARRLGISQHTVKFHLEAVFAKLGVRTRAEAVMEGLRRGLVEL